jgi:hypothetical protein
MRRSSGRCNFGCRIERQHGRMGATVMQKARLRHHYRRKLVRTGKITAPVQPDKYDWEVRLPGGTWIPWAGLQRDTVRRDN